jgi:inner membrane protein
LIGGWAIKHLYTSYLNKVLPFINASQKDWTRLFFWSIFTHPLLDAFTAYGTQLFAPFSDYRVAFNTISVADPIYTIPFLLCLIAASFYRRDQVMRRYLNFMGIILSSAYLLFTVFNKKRIDRVFEQSFQAENIDYKRFRTGPSIFNNILWNGVAETEDAYYYGMYSLLDKEPKVYQFFKTPKNHHLIAAYEDDPDIKILQWFTDGYYTVDQMPDNKLQIGDMRYGTIKERQARPEDYVFKFSIVPNDEGGVDAFEARDMDQREDAFGDLWTRIKGR